LASPTSLNRDVAWLRPNFNFSFFPTQDSERLPAVASQQIAKNQRFLEKNFAYRTEKITNEILRKFRLTNDKRFASLSQIFNLIRNNFSAPI
jgi:hypothetical protein